MATKRLLKELEAYNRGPSPHVLRLEPVNDDNLLSLSADLRGPDGTAYQDGIFTLALQIPESYPSTAPKITFTTPCAHPNISFRTGEICLDLLTSKAWTPAYGVVTALEAVQQLMATPGEPDSPLNVDLAKLYRDGDIVGAEGLVRFYTRLYAVRR
ncbi:hypothetical protein R9X50_00382300 [Acrodontium crateriforme]|uniref:UBC core domain-containing protein n=1 Tax=Acrodontium crateriforme TaxID=150365 RepID=A0AAQ3R7T3_9PEZI|nr:hypothetical protein R9X50_00382300 [Acrodontium crateriforme]